MRKLLTSLFCLLITLLPLHAQRPFRIPLGKQTSPVTLQGKAKLARMNISHQLNRRLARTFQQVQEAQEQLPSDHQLIIGEPIQQIFKTDELNPVELYPEQTFLKNSSQTGKYLAIRNNRLLLQEIRRMEKIWAQIDENLPRLYQEAGATPQPQNPIPWLADIIPPQTTQLFIGEAHGYTEIHQAVAQLLQELRARQPLREIILFTEFLPENFTWTGHNPNVFTVPEHLQKFFPLWNHALQAQITPIGLELPAAVDDMCVIRYLNSNNNLDKQSVWASLEGIRLRNERWEKTLARYREQHPNALFIIYTGADHSLYNRPFTLANMPGEQPFVSVLYPTHYESFVPAGRFSGKIVAKPMRGPLEKLVDQLDFQHPIVKWESADLAQIAGFDVRIKIPVQLPNVDN